MHLTCPKCQQGFRLDPSQLGDRGRRVKCSHCAHIWFQASKENPEPLTSSPSEPPGAFAQSPSTNDVTHSSSVAEMSARNQEISESLATLANLKNPKDWGM